MHLRLVVWWMWGQSSRVHLEFKGSTQGQWSPGVMGRVDLRSWPLSQVDLVTLQPPNHTGSNATHRSTKPEPYKIFSCQVYLSASSGNRIFIYNIVLEALVEGVMGGHIGDHERGSSWSPKMFLIRCSKDPFFHKMLISMPGMKRSLRFRFRCVQFNRWWLYYTQIWILRQMEDHMMSEWVRMGW